MKSKEGRPRTPDALDQGRSGRELAAGAQRSPGVMSMAHPACGPVHAENTFI